MGTILASAIISKARYVLQDPSPVRWTDAELLGWINDAQREICGVFPELSSTKENVGMAAGTYQTLPDEGIAVLRVVRNMGANGAVPGNAIRLVAHEILDDLIPDWHSVAPSLTIKHWVNDPRDPHHFYVYPPSVSPNELEVLYTVAPTDLATVGTAIGLDDIYQNPILDYVLYRAFDKELDIVGTADAAARHYAKFQAWLTAKKGVDTGAQESRQ